MRRILTTLGLMLLVCGSLAAQSDIKPAYQKWLDEDVAYIITAEERSAFQSLKTNQEREQFIEAFWVRRDPDPDTTENEYRREHYARIAHASEHFGFKGLAGWRTDRGRIFIMYGKPDEVQKTSNGEAWVYKYFPATGQSIRIEFTDVTGGGDLRLHKPML